MTKYNDMQFKMIFNNSRCGWQWKDLNRFICLKIWPRLPKQSTRAIRISNPKYHFSSIKSNKSDALDLIYNTSLPVETITINPNINSNNNFNKQTSISESDVFSPHSPNTKNAAASSDDTMMYGPLNHTVNHTGMI